MQAPRDGTPARLDVLVEFVRLTLSLFGAGALVAATLAGAGIWLLMTEPVTVADAIREGEVSPLFKALAGAIYDAFRGLLRFL